MFWAGYLAGIGTVLVLEAAAVALLLHQAAKAEPLSRDEAERLAAKVREVLERQSLVVLKPMDDVGSQLVSRN